MQQLAILTCVLMSAMNARGSSILGSSQCTWGPAYWCSHVTTARECGAMKHCIQNVWKPAVVSRDSTTGLCATCEVLVGDAAKLVEQKATQEEVTDLLTRGCGAIPDVTYQNQCKQLVQEYAPEIMQLLAQEVEPSVICNVLGMCKNELKTASGSKAPHVFLHKAKKSEPAAARARVALFSTECDLCKTVIAELKAEIGTNATEKEVEDYLKKNMCARLGGLEAMCDQLVELYAPDIFKMLMADMDAETICSAIHMCTKRASDLQRKQLKTKFVHQLSARVGDSCSDCKAEVQKVIDFFESNTTEAEVEDLLDQSLCANLGPLEDTCKQMVATYVPVIFQMLQDDADPAQICQIIGFCSTRAHLMSATLAKARSRATTLVKDAGECAMCTLVLKEVEDLLSKNTSEAEIVKALDTVCSVLPSDLSAECKSFVDQYAPEIINLLVLELSPKQICTLLGLCSGSGARVFANPECEMCQLLIGYLDQQLAGNKSAAAIEKALDEVCGLLPSAYTSQCDSLVQQYGPMIVKLLSELVDPTQVCKELGLCTGSRASAARLGASPCTYGPSYWCASRKNAQKCKAVSHCKAHVWLN